MIVFKRCLEKSFSDTKTAYIFLLYFYESPSTCFHLESGTLTSYTSNKARGEVDEKTGIYLRQNRED